MKKVMLSVAILTICFSAAIALARDKVVVIPLNTKAATAPDKFWGQGRPGVKLLIHDIPSGYCSANGINFALSFNISTWNSAASVCPSGTWVCQQDEVTTECPLPAGSYPSYGCNGTLIESNPVLGWNAEADPVNQGNGMATYSSLARPPVSVCNNLHVWCCWN